MLNTGWMYQLKQHWRECPVVKTRSGCPIFFWPTVVLMVTQCAYSASADVLYQHGWPQLAESVSRWFCTIHKRNLRFLRGNFPPQPLSPANIQKHAKFKFKNGESGGLRPPDPLHILRGLRPLKLPRFWFEHQQILDIGQFFSSVTSFVVVTNWLTSMTRRHM